MPGLEHIRAAHAIYSKVGFGVVGHVEAMHRSLDWEYSMIIKPS